MPLNQKFTGDFKQLAREYDKLLVQQVKQDEQLRKLAATAEKSGGSQEKQNRLIASSGKKAIGSIKGMALQYIGVLQALALVNSELQRKRDLDEKSRTTAERIGIAQTSIADNLPADATPADLQRIDARIQKIRATAKLKSAVPVFESVAKLISATGDIEGSLRMAEAAAPKFRLRPEEMAEFANTAGSVKVATGLTEMQTLGFLETVMSQVRATKVSELKNLTPALAAGALAQQGVSKTEAAKATAAVFAAVSKAADDRTGERSKTASIALQAKLEKVFPADGLSIVDQIQKIQSKSIDERKKFVSKGFGTDMQAAIMDLITPMSETDKSMQAALNAIKPSAEVAKRKQALYNVGTQQIVSANTAAQLTGSVEGALLSPAAVDRGTARNAVNQFYDAPNSKLWLQGASQFLDNRYLDFALDQPAAAVEILRSKERAVRAGTEGSAKDFDSSQRPDSELNEIELGQLKVIRQAIEGIFEMQTKNRRSGEAANQSRVHDERD